MIDLTGNTNFAAFKNLQGEYIVPRTNLAAIDMTVANGLNVSGNTIYISVASSLDITNGTADKVVFADALKDVLATYTKYILVDVIEDASI